MCQKIATLICSVSQSVFSFFFLSQPLQQLSAVESLPLAKAEPAQTCGPPAENKKIMWSCGHVDIQSCCHLNIQSCGHVVMLSFGRVVMWSCCYVVMLLCSHVVMWSCCYVVMLLCGHVVMWSCGHVVMWSCGHVVMWSCGYVVIAQVNQNYKTINTFTL